MLTVNLRELKLASQDIIPDGQPNRIFYKLLTQTDPRSALHYGTAFQSRWNLAGQAAEKQWLPDKPNRTIKQADGFPVMSARPISIADHDFDRKTQSRSPLRIAIFKVLGSIATIVAEQFQPTDIAKPGAG
ncbi:hypothetical protein PAXINDRAFT_14804 [Paxillus involutus ATCC 200175]|uniref:Uncharacterized protein n=1 Tax=Paxillus involutus ATCC 200175 TaxID=664439 RepID=A0A0C9T9L9_PAXIN|nr:hypothetical protein PAXINDRAFT_14804 [Paxillus involutus ATCC 200175]